MIANLETLAQGGYILKQTFDPNRCFKQPLKSIILVFEAQLDMPVRLQIIFISRLIVRNLRLTYYGSKVIFFLNVNYISVEEAR